jgi:hypothetical protein
LVTNDLDFSDRGATDHPTTLESWLSASVARHRPSTW